MFFYFHEHQKALAGLNLDFRTRFVINKIFFLSRLLKKQEENIFTLEARKNFEQTKQGFYSQISEEIESLRI